MGQWKVDEENFLLVLSHEENDDLKTKKSSLESIIKEAHEELLTKKNFLESTGNEKQTVVAEKDSLVQQHNELKENFQHQKAKMERIKAESDAHSAQLQWMHSIMATKDDRVKAAQNKVQELQYELKRRDEELLSTEKKSSRCSHIKKNKCTTTNSFKM